MQNLLGAGCVEHVDFADLSKVNFNTLPFSEATANLGQQFVSLRDINRDTCIVEMDLAVTEESLEKESDERLKGIVHAANDSSMRSCVFALAHLQRRHGMDYAFDDSEQRCFDLQPIPVQLRSATASNTCIARASA